jgi:homoserine dehydrogenase
VKPPLKIAVAGLGTVGAGTLQLLARQAELLAVRAGRRSVVAAVSARDRRRDRGTDLSAVRWYEDAVAMTADPEIDVVVELIGGAEGVALNVIESALKHKKHVVTANKALMASTGPGSPPRREGGVALAFEAAVAGGIRSSRPCAKASPATGWPRLRHPQRHLELHPDDDARAAANSPSARRGQARLCQTDQASTSTASTPRTSSRSGERRVRRPVDLAGVYAEGSAISAARHRFRRRARLPHQAVGHRPADRSWLEQRPPCMVPRETPIAAVEGCSAVVARAISSGASCWKGGAPALPTASSVAADLVDIAAGRYVPPFSAGRLARRAARARWSGTRAPLHSADGGRSAGVIADVAAALRTSMSRWIDDPARPAPGSRSGGADDACHHRGSNAARIERIAALDSPRAAAHDPHRRL